MDKINQERDDSQSIIDYINAFLPQGFWLSNLINLEPGWQVNLSDENGIVVGTGASIEEALEACRSKAAAHEYIGRFKLPESSEVKIKDLAEALGLRTRVMPEVKRRV